MCVRSNIMGLTTGLVSSIKMRLEMENPPTKLKELSKMLSDPTDIIVIIGNKGFKGKTIMDYSHVHGVPGGESVTVSFVCTGPIAIINEDQCNASEKQP
jgi:hypothetical protein